SASAMAAADMDGDGALEAFIGGRVVAGRYPEPGQSMIIPSDKSKKPILDAVQNVGMVSGAVWSDLDGDGFPELILACEWGPLRLFKNNRGALTPWNPP